MGRALARNLENGPQLIIAIAASRDREAFSELFGYFAPRIKGYYRRLGMTNDAAEELAQETLLRVRREAARFDPARAAASTWIFATARNLRIDALRRTRPLGSISREEIQADPVEPTPAEAVLVVEQERRIHEALRSLPADQAEVVALSFFDGKPHAEISRSLGLPLGTVKSRLRLAVRRLRMCFDELNT